MRILVYEGLASAHDLFLEKLKKVYTIAVLFCENGFARNKSHPSEAWELKFDVQNI